LLPEGLFHRKYLRRSVDYGRHLVMPFPWPLDMAPSCV
jgi:hypothetical protein